MKIEDVQGTLQKQIIADLNVKPTIVVDDETDRRIDLLKEYAVNCGARSMVLGVSGGVDSTTAGRMIVLACERARAEGHNIRSIMVRLPYGEQRDEDDALKALEFIGADEVMVINIQGAADAMLFQLNYEVQFQTRAEQDFVMGNIKARQRMIAQYAIAGASNGLVVGTDHAGEAVMGFFTKFGDGAADIMPLSGLTKNQVREIAAYLGAPQHLVNKTPTADLEDLNPGKPDEEAFGIPYEHVDTFLKGGQVPTESAKVIIETFNKTAHKRELPVTL